MSIIPGRLIVQMLPDGAVRLVFIDSMGSGIASPITAKDLDEAEALFVECGLSAERAAALRNEVERNEVVSLETSIDEKMARKFRYSKLI